MDFLGYGNFYYWFKAKIRDIRYFPREVKWYFQRANRGYADSDVWGFDYYLIKVILGGLKRLRKNKCGIPATAKTGNSDYDYNEERWDKILDTMINTFETAQKIVDYDYCYFPLKEFTNKEYEECKSRMGEICHVMSLEETIEYEKGWDNFRKYFFSLWD